MEYKICRNWLTIISLAAIALLDPFSHSCEAGDPYLDAVVRFTRPSGSHDDGIPVAECLGEPSNPTVSIDTPEILTVAFIDNIVIDGPGADLLIEENAGGDSDVDIFGSEDGVNFEFLLRTDTDASIDLANYSLSTLKYLRLAGIQNGGSTPGYDFQGATALNSMDVEVCENGFHATEVVSFDRPAGSHDDGQPVTSVLGPPNLETISVDTPENLTLGFGGLSMVDGPGADFFIYELGNGDSAVNVLGSEDGTNFELLLTTDRSIGIDLATTTFSGRLRFIRIEGLADGGQVPGYDLDAIVALNFECPSKPESINVFRGIVVDGGLTDVQESDDAYFRLNPGFTLTGDEAPVWVEFFGNSTGAPSQVNVESQASTPGITYTTEAWNWVTSTYEELGSQPEQFNIDQMVSFEMTPDHLGANGELQTRVGWRQTGFVLNFPWEIRIDQVTWN